MCQLLVHFTKLIKTEEHHMRNPRRVLAVFLQVFLKKPVAYKVAITLSIKACMILVLDVVFLEVFIT